MPRAAAPVRAVLRPLMRLAWHPRIDGASHVPATGPVILASNHLSFQDSVLIPLAAPRPVSFLAKAEYFEGHGAGGLLRRQFFAGLGAIPVRRGVNREFQSSLDAALALLESGGAFGIYPEGTRSRDGRLHRGRTGVAWLAMASGAPVVPVAVAGTARLGSAAALLPGAARPVVRFGPVLEFPAHRGNAGSAPARRRVTDQIMDAIGALSGQERAHTYNPPPGDEPG
ncbi:lysophospholipid acyltransferase family protein [Micromonospora sp. NPDC002296]|uniref:lysophospholipid acyltransferase family protein n=1 Tax=Micromonospora sp. NPDC002296 TaxID=3154271 RepID=UPI00331F466E